MTYGKEIKYIIILYRSTLQKVFPISTERGRCEIALPRSARQSFSEIRNKGDLITKNTEDLGSTNALAPPWHAVRQRGESDNTSEAKTQASNIRL